MSQDCPYLIPSETSAIYQLLVTASTACVGIDKPIKLPVINRNDFDNTCGSTIGSGGSGTVYKVKGLNRVYKTIPSDCFANGDEIRISKIAFECGVAPTFHGAFLVQQDKDEFVAIEMDKAGKSLRKIMHKLEVIRETQEVFPKKAQTHTERKSQMPFEDAAKEIYGSEEVFYFKLFSLIKRLAEHNIAYSDTNVGNIMPNYSIKKGLKAGKDLQLIDFGDAVLMENIESAATALKTALYNRTYLNAFSDLPGLSEESQKLIAWFSDPSGDK